MADVNTRGPESAITRRERAQLLIVIGIVVAITLVSLALFLNSIIYAENIGSRGADIGGSEAIEFVDTVEGEGQTLLADAREENEEGEYEVNEEEFESSVSDWNEQARLHYTSRGVYTSVTVDHVEPDGSHANLLVTYENSQITYVTEIEVVAGENDD